MVDNQGIESEPVWQPGDAASDPHGLIFMRISHVVSFESVDAWVDQVGVVWLDFKMSRPLTPLVLDGKPVSP